MDARQPREVVMTLESVLVPALIGTVLGAVGFPALVYLGIITNYKKLRTHYAHIPQDRAFYRAFALMGATFGGAYGAEMPLLDASGIKDPWYGLIMIITGLIVFFPMMLFLKRHAQRAAAKSNMEVPDEPQP